MSVMASHITGYSSVCFITCSCKERRNIHQISVTRALSEGNPPVTSGFPHKRSVMRWTIPWYNVIMHPCAEEANLTNVSEIVWYLTIPTPIPTKMYVIWDISHNRYVNIYNNHRNNWLFFVKILHLFSWEDLRSQNPLWSHTTTNHFPFYHRMNPLNAIYGTQKN